MGDVAHLSTVDLFARIPLVCMGAPIVVLTPGVDR